ncbi:LacI family DNA-binding transcriptional regulator [Leifsonia sp. C5G2]|uniref:LacI family DNA-binding transcriptional regulator n=1 Tax=Leifsonia sp. C5G2 TaxID=2735269 RepID=UPI001585451B|nr:LacI family DNA-binding transcriptional regulator [Leifsonia sp. C5G2]NUU05211.1 LacI family DNA-binding transcriptional regulator [Leifsonia sp. C5G2]
MATMIDVARQARVSVSTVSHVINGTRHVEQATRKRVLDAIEATGYRQDTLARAMRRSRSDSIGLVLSDVGEPAFAEMIHGVESAAAEHGLTLILANSAEDSDREKRAVQALLNRRVDGLVLASAAISDRGLLEELQGEKAPTVLLDRVYPELDFDQVGANNRETMYALASQLISQGHARFLVVAGDLRVPTLRERHDGFTEAVAAGGLRTEDQHILSSDEGSPRPVPDIEAVRKALTLSRPTAVIASSTPLAAVALRALAAEGLRIPEDLAFAAFDGFDNSDLFEPQITTVRQPAFEMGRTAVGLLIDRLEKPSTSHRTVRLKQRIDWRSSTRTENVVAPEHDAGLA